MNYLWGHYYRTNQPFARQTTSRAGDWAKPAAVDVIAGTTFSADDDETPVDRWPEEDGRLDSARP